MPWVVQLGSEPNLAAGNTGVFDALSNFGFVAICERTDPSGCEEAWESRKYVRVDVSVARLKSDLYSLADLIGSGLPGSEANPWHTVAGIEREHRPRGSVSNYKLPKVAV